MKFKYKGRNKDGELQVGFVEAYSKDAAVNILLSHNVFVLSIEDASHLSFPDRIAKMFQHVGLGDLMVFTRQFATLLEAKIPLSDSLRNLQKQTKNSLLSETIREVSQDVDSGLALSQALEKQQGVFDEFYVSMIRSAEITGRMEEAMVYLAGYLEKQKLWKSRVMNSLLYPAIILLMFFGVLLLINFSVIPNLKNVFADSAVDLPWFTRAIFGMSDFISDWWWALLIIVLPLAAYVFDYARSKEGRIVSNEVLLRLPIFGRLFSKMYVARFAESLSVLIKGDIPIAQAIEVTAHSVGSYAYRDALYEIGSSVRSGELLSDNINRYPDFFPPLVGQMIAIGETTGRMEELLERIAILFEREVDDMMSRLGELIQPFMMVVVGLFIGLLFAAILIPLYDLMQTFKI